MKNAKIIFQKWKRLQKTGEENQKLRAKEEKKNQKIQLRTLEREEAAREKKKSCKVKRQKRKLESRSAGKKTGVA